MLKRPYFYQSPTQNPYKTLALEETMLQHITPDEIILYLYTHADTVVIGKNQNAWAECHHTQLLADGGKLARRISGGGAVFHDVGNLNFSFIMNRENYDLQRQLKVILDAVRSFGIQATFSGRNDITVDGRKFSGNAFCFRQEGAFHHGTILLRTSVEKITRYLSVSQEKIESKGIASVRARVINLCDINPDITPESMAAALKQSFSREYGTPQAYPLTPDIAREAEELAVRNASWEWQFGQSPAFDITFGTRFAWGGIECRLALRDARVTDAQVYSDSMEPDLISALPAQLTGCAFRSAELARAVLGTPHTPAQQPLLDDIAAFIRQQNY